MQFRKLNIIVGWAVFAIALTTYLLTIEPSTSQWDCGEFIATSYKLEVGHPPGTPFFFLINRLGAMFASDPSNVAIIVNGLSALESAFTILFLFWSISHLGRRIYRKKANELDTDQIWAVIGAATIGALAYTFSDTFWFSAVEAEVYALSSLFTAVVFWAILKWEDVADEPGGNRWLVLIAYLMGLSIGAHILNLLAIPALVFIFYFKKFPDRPKKDLWKPTIASLLVLGGFYFLTPTTISIGAFVDRIFVNTLGLPVNSGLVFTVVALLVALGFGVWKTYQKQRAVLNTIFLSAAMVVIGFSTYGIVLIRASANPPMNSNHPSNPYALKSFINREQYGSSPLLMGETFNSTQVGYKYLETYTIDDKGKYVPSKYTKGLEYDPATDVFFPRMWSSNKEHIDGYESWIDFKGTTVRDSNGDLVTIPTFGENLAFFFTYQINNMYWRYFLWNFAGRQSDIQYDGIANGNWRSGINFVDEIYLGPQDNLPSEMANNKGRNNYFFLPFLLGLMGLFFQLRRDGRNFTVVMMLFLLTGLAIIVYLNQTPYQVRERDYAYAGSFYAFAIWIGLGLLSVYEGLKKAKAPAKVAAVGAFVLCASVPAIMAQQNWDDHDRSGRYFARDMGKNYLSCLQPNSILLNHGDNDTFAAWYTQEAEEFRTDVRTLNTQYIMGDWYIDQMRIKANDGEAMPINLPRSKYQGKPSPPFFVEERVHPGGPDKVWTIQEVMQVIYSDQPHTKTARGSYDIIPARRIAIPVNKENVLKSGIVRPEEAHMIQDTIYMNLNKDYYDIGQIIVMDIIANSDWTRPIYTTQYQYWMDFGLLAFSEKERFSYLKQVGSVHLLVPYKSDVSMRFDVGHINSNELYDNLMNKTKFGNLYNPKVYADDFVHHTLQSVRYRETFARLAYQLAEEGDSLRAMEVLDHIMKELPTSQIRQNSDIVKIARAYWRAGDHAKGDALANEFFRVKSEYVKYFERFTGNKHDAVVNSIDYILRYDIVPLYEAAEEFSKKELSDKIMTLFE